MTGQDLGWADGHLWWLPLAAVFVLLLVLVHFQLRARIIARLGHVPLIEKMTASTSVGKQWLKWMLVVTSFALIGAAAMRPQYGTREAELKNRGIDVVIAVDLSKSMLVQDVAPNRLKAAVSELKNIIDRLPGGRVAVVPFAGTAFTQCALTTDFAAVKTYLDDLRVEDMPVGGTRIGNAIRHAMELFETKLTDAEKENPAFTGLEQIEPSHYKAVILVTDGEDHDADAVAAAQLASGRNIRIYTVGIGSQNSAAPIPQIADDGSRVGWVTGEQSQKLFSDLNVGLLNDVAGAANGVSAIYGQTDVAGTISQSLDTLEKQEYEHQFQDLREDRFQFLLIPAFAFLLVEALLTDRRRRARRTGVGLMAAKARVTP
ncbi:MAG: VWA domain-containing protein [Myxococcales bacterium]|nr:VWA domain-containing protein [Myxococcales bacterium]